jgi:hypothetical protein
MKAGIVGYKRVGETLEGEWTHEQTGGIRAREVVLDVAVGKVTGDWPVEIYRPDGALYYSGTLSVTTLGQSLKLAWTGAFREDGKQANFAGIGFVLNPDLIVATFEQTE